MQIIESHPFLCLFFAFWALLIVIFLVFLIGWKEEMVEDYDEYDKNNYL
jgi:hypothetical protein